MSCSKRDRPVRTALCSWRLGPFELPVWLAICKLVLTLFFFLFIEFIGVILVDKIIQVSGSQFHTHHLYTVLCVHHPRSRVCLSRFIPHVPSSTSPYPTFPWQSPHCCLRPWVFPSFLFCLLLYSFNSSTPLTIAVILLFICESVFICSLDSTYEWTHMILVFLWLAYFN